MIHKDYDSKVSVEKKTLVVSLKEFGTKTDWLTINQPSQSNSYSNRPFLSSERAPHVSKLTTVWLIKIWSWAPVGCFTPRYTGQLTVGRNIDLTLTLTCCSQSVSQSVSQITAGASVIVSCCCYKLRYGGSSGTQRKRRFRRWKPLQSNG
jgi:hypothetical protein